MPEFLDAALAEAGEERLQAARRGRVLPARAACHLRDLEREGYLVRLRRMLAEKAPAAAGFDGGRDRPGARLPAQDAQRSPRRNSPAAGASWWALLAPLTESDLAREGTFMGRPVCLADVIAMMVEHDRGHREEIARLVDSLED
jgi:hypothetical protein